MPVSQTWAAVCQHCNLSCTPTSPLEAAAHRPGALSPHSLCNGLRLRNYDEPWARPLSPTAPAHVGHSVPRLGPNSKKPEGSEFLRKRESGKCPGRTEEAPACANTGISFLCDLGQSLPLSGPQSPRSSDVCRMRKEKGRGKHGLCSWNLDEHSPLAVPSANWLAQCPAGILVLTLTWAGTHWLRLPAQALHLRVRSLGRP